MQKETECWTPELSYIEMPGALKLAKYTSREPVWGSGTVPTEWQTGVMVLIFKKGDRRVCSNYRGISLSGKVFCEVLEKRLWLIVERQIQEEQCGFRHSCGTVVQLFTFSCLLGAP